MVHDTNRDQRAAVISGAGGGIGAALCGAFSQAGYWTIGIDKIRKPPADTECDDGNVCTDDACDPTTYACITSFNTDPCDDGNAQTTNDVCAGGVCVGSIASDDGSNWACMDTRQVNEGKRCPNDFWESYQWNTKSEGTSAKCKNIPGCAWKESGSDWGYNKACNAWSCEIREAPQLKTYVCCQPNPSSSSFSIISPPNKAEWREGTECSIGWENNGKRSQSECKGSSSDGRNCAKLSSGCVYQSNTQICTCPADGSAECKGESKSTSPSDVKELNQGCCAGLNETSANCAPGGVCTSVKYCVYCGDGVCKSPEGEYNCPKDCATAGVESDCGNGVCESDETKETCLKDCECDDVSDCKEGNLCTIDTCASNKCVYTPNDRRTFNANDMSLFIAPSCTDNNLCTVNDACSDGTCVGTLKTCDDSDSCTDDSCATDTGLCHNVFNNARCDCYVDTDCDDGDLCTGDTCVDNKCVATITQDSVCVDGNDCTNDDKCLANGTCVGTPMLVDDFIECTIDGCVNGEASHDASGCACNENKPCPVTDDVCIDSVECDLDTKTCKTTYNAGNECDDNDKCTTDDKCNKGVCIGTLNACDDGVDCTDDSCEADECIHSTLKCDCDGDRICNDNDPCTDDSCVAGSCQKDFNTASCGDGKTCDEGHCIADFTLGDVNNDDTIDVLDLVAASKLIRDASCMIADGCLAADVNCDNSAIGDKSVTELDLIALSNAISNAINGVVAIACP